jgi:glycosyltransferase involved in cell wall biosynthesis
MVSVLLPAWNAGPTIDACLRSIQRQTLADWECVVVDDGSTDATRSIAEDVAASDPRFRVVSPDHAGLVAALNLGLWACRGEYVARMDADDLMMRARLDVQAAALDADPGFSAVGSHVRIFPRALVTPRRREYEAWLNGMDSTESIRRNAFVECPVAHPTLMIRRDVLQAFAYRDVDWPEDYDLLLRLLAGGHRVSVVPRRLVAWRDSPARLSRTDARYGLDRFTACRADFLSHGFLRDARTYVLWGYGDTGRLLRRALLAHGKSPSHIVEVKAQRIGQRIHGAPVIAVEALPALRGARVIVSVARAGPRAEIRAALTAMDFVELRDFVCAA